MTFLKPILVHVLVSICLTCSTYAVTFSSFIVLVYFEFVILGIQCSDVLDL